MNQLCKVCGEPAAGYHFGAFTCEGCKSFFGRTYNNLSALGECKNSGQCVINKKNRTSCKSCRLKKCLMVGMSKSGSRYGRRSNWFKIHCLIQDQAEMNKLTEQGVLSNGHHNHFQHYFGSSNNNNSNNNGDCHKDSNSSATASPTGTASPSDTFKRYSPYEPKLHPSSNGLPHLESSSPPYDRKDTIVFHPLPLSPVSPMSPLQSKFFFHHHHHPSGSSTLLSKSFNGLSKMINGSSLTTGGVAADYYPYSSRYLPVVPVVKSRVDVAPIALDCYADVPEQEKPMDLTIRKSDDPESGDTLLDVETFVKREECSEDEGEGIGQPMEGAVLRETPLDLTKRLSRED